VTITVALEHRTTYTFDRLVQVHPHVIRLRPAPHCRTKIDSYSLTVEPADHFINWQQDPFGNFLARLVFPERTKQLSITVGLVADMSVINPFDFFMEEYAEKYGFSYPADLAADLEPYLRPVDENGSGPGPLVTKFLERLDAKPGTRMVDFLVRLNSAVYNEVGYSVRMEAGVQTPDYTLQSAIGSCRDSAWLLVSLLRQLGLAARFVSGYLIQLTSDVESLDGPSGPVQDFTDLHAWAEVYIPGAGWIGMDATSGLFAGEGHIPLSATPHPTSAAAISGSTEPCSATLDFANIVRRVHEDPRVTLPYSLDQWEQVDELGRFVDEKLAEGDVRLTMGGEPTFVSIDDFVADEWTTAADGPDKRAKANELAQRMREVYAAHGLVQRSQGKWYPGEPLPRWQIAMFWRTDHKPLWHRQDLLDDPWFEDPERPTPRPGAAVRLAEAIAIGFALPLSQVRRAFEDPVAKLAQHIRLPAGEPEPRDLESDSPDARRKLVTALDAPVTTPTAFVLPLHRLPDDRGWASADWRLRRGRIALTPGDSPAGLRLPLDAISWEGPDPIPEHDPTAPPVELEYRAVANPGVAQIVDPKDAPTTAVVVEQRGDHVYVFLPPLEEFKDFAELLGVIEQAAAVTDTRIVIEGYGPPYDPAIQTLTVTPDPGVIEVNVQPTASWAEQVELTTKLYEQARVTRLGTETFAIDGAHGGTGGGNHITLGGSNPAESPLLRRPDLLVSLLTHWQRHPSLSYLFSGRFIGPTSQAPRVDEGRQESLYELEIAFNEIQRILDRDGEAPPWIVDRALRHLLTDITGNTHRAEFCIDKLYSPDSARGRLGLLELRGFEMPPHPQMALVQTLLVRALVARFWAEPLQAPLLRHGLDLHGRFLLPHFVAADIAEVAADLRRHGFEFQTSWLDPFLEFRFPRLGSTTIAGVHLELRFAIEPWHVLGEEATGAGTARYVDSSVERMQVVLDGFNPSRQLLTVNGIPVPLTPTGAAGQHIAGVRYRAWQPWSALHPTIPVQSPLVFDLVDLESAVSLGGCTYHVVHPGGRSYDTPPVNAMEAEARRTARFDENGFTAGEVDAAGLRELNTRIKADQWVPHILDLRRVQALL
jgi:uncharacterized protein (DUF2126 family)/transglutaminase-like putative cysteine protease